MTSFGQSLICFGVPHSSKVHSLINLSDAGFPIVPTLCINIQEWPSLEQLRTVASWPEQLPLYVRICFDAVEYPHSFYQICKWDGLKQVFHILLAQASKFTKKPCDITIQPHLIERFGGAVAALGDLLIIEAVDGNARGLLREGRFSSRAILCGGRLVAEIDGGQQDALFWSRDSYQRRAGKSITWQDIRMLSAFSWCSPTLYEFCVTQEGKPLFLEAKKLPQDTFFFEDNGAFTIYPSQKVCIRKTFPLPSLSLCGEFKRNQLQIFTGGAYLSHLSVYAATKRLPMCFTRQI